MEDKYRSMSGPELAGDDAFIRWVLKGENQEQWNAWQEHDPETKLKFAEATHLIHSLSGLHVAQLSTSEKDVLWERIQYSTAQKTSERTYSLIRWTVLAAASLALLIWINIARNIEKVFVAAGEHQEIVLPEDSRIMINADSRISFNESGFIGDREIKLQGEAFFEVNPGEEFVVRTPYGAVQVLGTSFNVIARPDRFEVSCYTGKVRVSDPEKHSSVITAGQRIITKGKELDQESFPLSGKPEWIQGRFVFHDQPLSTVIAELERQYDIRVDLPANLKDIRYTGVFENGNLENALEIITWPLHLKYELDENSVIISQ